MYNKDLICRLIDYLQSVRGKYNKDELAASVKEKFNLIKDGKVFVCDWFAIRFSWSKTDSSSFSNVVLSLSKLQKYDRLPFIVCLVTPLNNYSFLANTTFLKKISHSSQALRVDNIRGSFLGNDIMRVFEGTTNEPANFEYLFNTHENYTFEENLVRLVEATNNIAPTGKRFIPNVYEGNPCNAEDIRRSGKERDGSMSEILEKILSDENVRLAKKRVYANKGAGGVDGVTVQELDEYMVQNWESIKQQIRERKYRPQPVLRVEIPKPNGSVRKLGIPTVVDRTYTKRD